MNLIDYLKHERAFWYQKTIDIRNDPQWQVYCNGRLHQIEALEAFINDNKPMGDI